MSGAVATLTRPGHAVAARWSERNSDERYFPEVAEAVLADDIALRDLDPAELAAELALAPDLPGQSEDPSILGRTSIVVWRDGRQIISVHVGQGASVDLVGPSFVGAFQVLAGAVVHTSCELRPERSVSKGFLVGQLEPRAPELLTAGARRRIPFEGHVGHRVVHLGPFGVVLSLATVGGVRRTLHFLAPSFAVASRNRIPLHRLQPELVLAIRAAGGDGNRALLERFVDGANAETALLMLLELALADGAGLDESVRLLEHAGERFAGWSRDFRQLVMGQRRLRMGAAALAHASREEDRLVLAAVLDDGAPAVVAALLAARYPERAPSDVLGAVRQRLTAGGDIGALALADRLELVAHIGR